MSNTERFAALALRLWTLATRFLLVFFLARYLAPSDVGLYGLLVATLGYVVYIMGMDMYTFTTREVLKSPSESWKSLTTSHVTFLSVVYIFVLPALLLLFVFGLLPWDVIYWFFALAITEHVSLEIDRMLVAMSDQFSASIVVFLRQAMLPTTIVPMMIFWPESRNLYFVLTLWVTFNGIAVLLGLTFILAKVRTGHASRPDWRWIRTGFTTSLAFLIGSLCLRVLFAADRQIVASFDGMETLGAYTFALSVGTGLSSTIAVAVHQFSYPRLVHAAHEKDRRKLEQGLFSMALQTGAISLTAILSVFFCKDLIVSWVGHGVYGEYSWLLLASVMVYALYNASLIPHYGLYALHGDRIILSSTVASLAIFAVAVAISLTLDTTAVVAVLIGLSAASLSLLISKQVGYRLLLNRQLPKDFV